MEKITVRLALEDDVDELVNLLTLLFTQEADFVPDLEKQRTGLQLIIAKPQHGHLLVATTTSGKVVGMVNLLYVISTAEGATVAILEDMVINPDYRGFGIGSILLEEAISFARKQGCKRITLLTDVNNEKAINFYAKHRFQKSNMIPLRLTL